MRLGGLAPEAFSTGCHGSAAALKALSVCRKANIHERYMLPAHNHAFMCDTTASQREQRAEEPQQQKRSVQFAVPVAPVHPLEALSAYRDVDIGERAPEIVRPSLGARVPHCQQPSMRLLCNKCSA